MRLIDAERLPNDNFFESCSDMEKAKIIGWMLQAPTVRDFGRVIRCMYCKHSEFDDYHGDYYCKKLRSWTNDDFYCAFGESEE